MATSVVQTVALHDLAEEYCDRRIADLKMQIFAETSRGALSKRPLLRSSGPSGG